MKACQVRRNWTGDPAARSVSSTTTAERRSSITTASPFHIAHPLRTSLHLCAPYHTSTTLAHLFPRLAAPRATQPGIRRPMRDLVNKVRRPIARPISIPRAYIPHSADHKRPQTSMRGQPSPHGWPAHAHLERVSRPQRRGRGRPCAPDRSQPLTTMRCDETRRGARQSWGREAGGQVRRTIASGLVCARHGLAPNSAPGAPEDPERRDGACCDDLVVASSFNDGGGDGTLADCASDV